MDQRSEGRWKRRLVATAAAAILAGALSGCASSPSAANGKLAVVAGEDMWGNIAAQLGGTHVAVTSIITNPNADPHEYTADAVDAAAIHAAKVVVVNGAGYDDFMGQLLSASGTSPDVLTVASIAHASGADPNPHFWYDLATVRAVAATIAASYERFDPNDASDFRARLATFDGSLAPIQAVITRMATSYANAPVAYTERVPGYLLAAADLRVASPTGFARAVEAGSDPSLSDTLAMEDLLAAHGVKVLLYNVQTVTPVTSTVRADAIAAHVAVVGVSETLPARYSTYQSWQLAQDSALLAALRA